MGAALAGNRKAEEAGGRVGWGSQEAARLCDIVAHSAAGTLDTGRGRASPHHV